MTTNQRYKSLLIDVLAAVSAVSNQKGGVLRRREEEEEKQQLN